MQSELDTQLGALAESHEHALAELGKNAEAEAERRWAGKLESARADWTAQLQSEVAAARSDQRALVSAGRFTRRTVASIASFEYPNSSLCLNPHSSKTIHYTQFH